MRTDAPVRVVVAEDSFLLRESLIRLLDDDAQVAVVGAADDYDVALRLVDEQRPDVVVTDVRMPPGQADEGIRLAASLRAAQPDLGVVVLSQYAEASYALRLLETGSLRRGYLLKDRVADGDQLVDAVLTVAGGGSVLDPLMVDAMIVARARAGGALDTLTPREREVLAAVAGGSSNRAIAAQLVISLRSVEKHINAIFAKLGLTGDQALDQRVKATLLFLADDA